MMVVMRGAIYLKNRMNQVLEHQLYYHHKILVVFLSQMVLRLLIILQVNHILLVLGIILVQEFPLVLDEN